MGKPPVRFRSILEAFRTAALVIVLGWAGVVALAYVITIPARSNLPRVESAMVTVVALTLLASWLIAWRTLAKRVILARAKGE